MKVLILGGTGAIGSPLVEYLAQEHKVYVTTRQERNNSSYCTYIKGNALNNTFVEKVFANDSYDCVVDFMDYMETDVFTRNLKIIRNKVKQYIFLSSARVYSNADEIITENTKRLYDVIEDEKLKCSEEYPFHKARQEDIVRMLCNETDCSYTIIRPYITYNTYRLQLGVLEKEQWLYRALENKRVYIPRDIIEKYTTLTLGDNVALTISRLIGNPKAYNEVFHIAGGNPIRWREVIDLYNKIFLDVLNRPLKITLVDDIDDYAKYTLRGVQIFHDRMLDRLFDNSKVEHVSGVGKDDYILVENGLADCLRTFLEKPSFRDLSIREEAYFDRLGKEKASISEYSIKRKVKYCIDRFFKLTL